MLDRAITEAAQASAAALFFKNRFLNNFAVIPGMCFDIFSLRMQLAFRWIIAN